MPRRAATGQGTTSAGTPHLPPLLAADCDRLAAQWRRRDRSFPCAPTRLRCAATRGQEAGGRGWMSRPRTSRSGSTKRRRRTRRGSSTGAGCDCCIRTCTAPTTRSFSSRPSGPPDSCPAPGRRCRSRGRPRPSARSPRWLVRVGRPRTARSDAAERPPPPRPTPPGTDECSECGGAPIRRARVRTVRRGRVRRGPAVLPAVRPQCLPRRAGHHADRGLVVADRPVPHRPRRRRQPARLVAVPQAGRRAAAAAAGGDDGGRARRDGAPGAAPAGTGAAGDGCSPPWS